MSDGICKYCGDIAKSDKGGRPKTVCRACRGRWIESAPRCSFPECENPRRSHELCTGHLSQQRRGLELSTLRPRVRVIDGHKLCRTCGEVKPVAEFGKKQQYVTEHCRACRGIKMRAETFGLEVDDVRHMLDRDNCECCDRPFRSTRDRHIDHDHRTDAVRGLICRDCNTALGCVDDDVDHLRALIRYLDSRR